MLLRPVLAAIACLCAVHAYAEISEKKPNIVFFLIDDLGYADCGFNGGQQIKTPNIDRLAKSGAIIESHYVQPVCSPTRSTLLTGRYPTHTGVYTIVSPGAPWGLPLAERTLADALRSAGYRTALTGKWHLGEFEKAYQPNARGFDHQYGHFFGMLDYYSHDRLNKLDWFRNGEPLKEAGYTTHLIAAEACKVIETGDRAKPLFLYVPFNGVHSPFQAPDEYLKPYGALKGNRQKLAGMLAAVDEAIGRIEESLKKAGMLENTLIVFSSDNGGPPPATIPRFVISRARSTKAAPAPRPSPPGPAASPPSNGCASRCTWSIGIRRSSNWPAAPSNRNSRSTDSMSGRC